MTVPQRPFGVALLAVLHVLQAILFFLGGLVLLVIGSLPRMMFRFPRHGGLLSIIGVVLLILAVLYVGFAWGLWNGKGWAWILSLVLAAIGVLIAILSLIRGGLGSILVLLIDVIILYYLTQPNVKAFFGEAKPITPTQTTPQASTTPSSGKFCSNCGAPLAASEKFCAHCGSNLQQ